MPRILVIRLSSIGDIVHALPAVAALGESLPEAEIAWAVESRFAELLAGNPFVRRVLPLDTLGWRARGRSAAAPEDVVGGLAALRRFHADVAIDFQGLVKSAVLGWLSHAPRRIGFARAWRREKPAALLYTERVEAPGREHVVEENLALVERFGARPVTRACWQFPLPRDHAAETQIERRLGEMDVERFVVINPGGGWTSKRWPPQQYAALIRALAEDEIVLVTGSPGEEPWIHEIVHSAGWAGAARVVYFPSTLLEFVALARRARLLVGGDTGPLHLAAAVGTPVVAIYGPTNPRRNGPFASGDIVLTNHPDSQELRRTHWNRMQARRPGYLEGVSTEDVLAAVRRRLAAADGA
jgi:lipopolysaccharide heptosyltransferase I